MAFDYEIRADGTAALATSDKVIDSLVAIEGEAKKVGTSLSSSFSTPAVKNAQGQFVATGVAAQQLAEKVKLAAASSTDLNAKLRAEHEMLERIHGPMKRFEQDMAALEALHKRGAVTAAEYARELARIGAAAGMSRGNPADAVSLTMPTAANSNGGAIAGQIAGMVGPAALAATAIKGVTDELTRWGDRRRDIEAASNSVLRFHDTMAQAQGAMQEQRELADDLHLNIRKTTEAYAAVREATAEYGLTSQQQVDITRNLTSAVINDGGAIEDVTAIMARFQMAQENGGMSSKELTAIWKKSDDVATLMGEALGLTWPQMQKLAKEGKFTSEMVAEMVGKLGLGDSSMRKYSERALDVNEVQKELNVSFMEAVRITLEAGEKYERTLPSTVEHIKRQQQAWIELHGNLSDTRPAIDGLVSAFEQMGTSLTQWGEGITNAITTSAPFVDFLDRMKVGLSIVQPVDTAVQKLATLEAAWAAMTNKSAAYTRQYEQQKKALQSIIRGPSTPSTADADARAQADEDSALAQQWSADAAAAAADRESDLSQTFADNKTPQGWGKGPRVEGLTNAEWIRRERDAQNEAELARKDPTAVDPVQQATIDQLKNSATELGDALVQAANGADIAWGDTLRKMVIGFELAIVKAMILRAIDSGAGGVGSVASAAVSSGGNHAMGGSFTAEGTGGTDSVPVLVRMSPGERADFTPKGQTSPTSFSRGNGGAGNSNVNLRVVNQGMSDRELMEAFDSPGGERVVSNIVRRNPGMFKSLLQ